jgi:short-subunit dehydrogenase
VVAVARRRDRLEELARELKSVEPLAADLTDTEQLGVVEARLSDPAQPVDLLVNCAGFGTQGRFAQLPVDTEDREVRLNVLALLRLTRAALPGMLDRRHGAVINVSSVAGHQPIPLWATYSASKAFVTTFSRAVAAELRGTGVHVMALLPGFTHSEFHDHSGFERKLIPGPAWMTPEAVAAIALRDVRRGRVHSFPGLHNRMTAAASRMSPWALTRRVLRVATRRMW